MTIERYKKQFADAKSFMTLDDAAYYIRRLKETEFRILPKTWRINGLARTRRMAQRVVCDEIVRALESAAPWEDYREIIAELEWPYMRRVIQHSMDGRWDYVNGRKWGEADAWFLEIWAAYHDVFNALPGIVPNITPWRMYETMLGSALTKLKTYRRNL